MSRSAPPDIVFVFPAGGSRGAAQVGILRSMVEAGIRADAVVGSSVGALNATFFAMDPTLAGVQRLETVWRAITREDVFGRNRYRTMTRLVRGQDHIYTPAALRHLIRRLCPLDDLAGARLPIHVATTDLDNGCARWWDQGPAAEILYASACLPGLFPPAILDGHRHVDGGVLEPAPIQRAVDLDATTVYVLGEISGPEDEQPGVLSALDVLIRSFAISRYARLPEPSALARPGQRVVVVPGADCRGVQITDFRQSGGLMHRSRLRSSRFLSELQAGDAADQEAAAAVADLDGDDDVSLRSA